MQQRRGGWLLALSLGLTVFVVIGAPRLASTISVVAAPATTQQERDIPFQTLAADPQGINAQLGESPKIFLITTPDELNRLQDLITPAQFSQVRKVDFQQVLLVAFFGGATTTGQRLMTIEHIALRGEDLVLYVHDSQAPANSNAPLLAISPYQIVQIARSAATFAPRHLVLHTADPLMQLPPAIPPDSPLSLISPLAAESEENITIEVTPIPDVAK